jgi:hypothetical protein
VHKIPREVRDLLRRRHWTPIKTRQRKHMVITARHESGVVHNIPISVSGSCQRALKNLEMNLKHLEEDHG